MDLDFGIAILSSSSPSKWIFMASNIFFSVSSIVAPVATQPGMSGEYAEKFFRAFSITIKNLFIQIFFSF